ncbi:S49 family peptidase [Novosphingobium colocasiae]
MVRIDSPGGAALAGERMRRAIDRYRQKGIPVIASMANVAASAGYMVAAPADRIFAEPDTITGSIGVFAIIPSFEDTLAQYGVTTDLGAGDAAIGPARCARRDQRRNLATAAGFGRKRLCEVRRRRGAGAQGSGRED